MRLIIQLGAAAAVLCALSNCASDRVASPPPKDGIVDAIRNTDFSARIPNGLGGNLDKGNQSDRPLLFPGFESEPPPLREANSQPGAPIRVASTDMGAVTSGTGVEINFENADIQTVAKTILGDILELNYVVDPRVQGTVTLASTGPVARKDVLPVFESVLRMSNAAIVRDGSLMKIVPIQEASGAGRVNVGAGQPGFGVSVVPLHYTSAATVARTAENFLSRPGAIRPDPARNLLLVQGTTAERQAALDVIAAFDVEWMHNQSVGVYPLKSTSPETMIHELERIFDAGDSGQGQGVIRFQPISRMNAVMAVTKNRKLLDQTTRWVSRLDRSDTSGTTVRIYHLKYGAAPRIAKILSEIFVGRSSGTDSPASQTAPGAATAQSRLDSLGNGSFEHGANSTGTSAPSTGVAGGTTPSRGSNPIAAAFESFSDRKSADSDLKTDASAATSGGTGRGVFQNVRITADAADNSIVVYSNQEDYRIIESALREIDRPQLQVAIEATVAEVTLTDQLQYGVQSFLSSSDLHLGNNNGSLSNLSVQPAASAAAASAAAGQTAVQSAVQQGLLGQVVPGYNLLLGSQASPKVILSALSTLTSVKVLSAPSLVVMDNQPALLEVGDEIPITTGSATVLSNSNTPIVNTIDMRNTGIILKVLPHVHANGTIQLEIEQEISNVVNPNQPTLTPTISERRIHSTVAVTSGQTMLLGGLISEQTQKTNSGLPGISQIQILSDLLNNNSTTKQRSEIIIFMRSQLIRDGVDARHVAEEFRDRLESMRR
ncbi:MAG: type II secretion system secretin GspD, partial [Steroidobacteraceae bacterium]